MTGTVGVQKFGVCLQTWSQCVILCTLCARVGGMQQGHHVPQSKVTRIVHTALCFTNANFFCCSERESENAVVEEAVGKVACWVPAKRVSQNAPLAVLHTVAPIWTNVWLRIMSNVVRNCCHSWVRTTAQEIQSKQFLNAQRIPSKSAQLRMCTQDVLQKSARRTAVNGG